MRKQQQTRRNHPQTFPSSIIQWNPNPAESSGIRHPNDGEADAQRVRQDLIPEDLPDLMVHLWFTHGPNPPIGPISFGHWWSRSQPPKCWMPSHLRVESPFLSSCHYWYFMWHSYCYNTTNILIWSYMILYVCMFSLSFLDFSTFFCRFSSDSLSVLTPPA